MVDIWAIGVTLYEIYHLKLMFQVGMYHDVVMRVINGEHQLVDSDCPESIKTLIMNCTKTNATDRPDINALLEQVNQFMRQTEQAKVHRGMSSMR